MNPLIFLLGMVCMHEDIWSKIVTLHGHTKALTLRAEELDTNQEFFFPSVIQQRDAHDHIIRAYAAKVGVKDFSGDAEQTDKYIRTNLDKALGHEYRAFFDIADWLAILYREEITATLTTYSSQCIRTAVPNYYSEIVPRLERLHRDIEGIRSRKDIGLGDGILEEVTLYRSLLQTLDDDWVRIADSLGSMEQLKAEEKNQNRKKYLAQVVVNILLLFVGLFVGWLGGWVQRGR